MVPEGFREYVKSLLADGPGVGISFWANVLRPVQSLTLYHHDPAFASAHYTVTTGWENGVRPVARQRPCRLLPARLCRSQPRQHGQWNGQPMGPRLGACQGSEARQHNVLPKLCAA